MDYIYTVARANWRFVWRMIERSSERAYVIIVKLDRIESILVLVCYNII